MKRNILLIALMALSSLLATSVLAQGTDPGVTPQGPGAGNGVCRFIDEDGDGFNDLAPDDDGDGIPNGLDPDYVRPEDGTGNQYRYQYEYMNRHQLGFLFDIFGQGFGHMVQQGPEGGYMFGPGDGTGNGNGPADGTGFGPGTGGSPGDGAGQGGNSQGGNSGGRGGHR